MNSVLKKRRKKERQRTTGKAIDINVSIDEKKRPDSHAHKTTLKTGKNATEKIGIEKSKENKGKNIGTNGRFPEEIGGRCVLSTAEKTVQRQLPFIDNGHFGCILLYYSMQ